MKKFLIIALVLGVVVFGGLLWLVTNADDLVAGLIESEGSKVTGTKVSVSGVELSVKDGSGEVDGLTIASPDGFTPAYAFELEGVVLDVDVRSLRDKVIVIDEIRVTEPRVAAQVLEDGSSNILALQRHVQDYGAGQSGGGGGGDAPATDKRLRIRKFVFDGGDVSLDATALGDDKVRTVQLPAFTLNDIGGPEGAAPDEVAQAVLSALTRKAAETIARSGVEQKARDVIEDKAGEAAKGLLDKLGG